jgi:alpha-beta hydrolase superfamily lysophospholipase
VAILPRLFTLLAVVLAAAATVANSQLPALGAGGLLHPWRRAVMMPAPDGCLDATFAGAGVTLKGWQCRTSGARRGAIVYLHGVADNRTSALGVVHRFVPRGLDVIAYDSRAHGESDGEACTYGVFEKHDLRLVLNTLEAAAPVLLIHGEDDLDTPPAHSQRVFAALKGPKRLMLVRGAAHNGSLRAEVWEEIHGWLDTVLGLQE